MRVKNFNDPVTKSNGNRTTLSEMGGGGYELTPATNSELGGVIIGDGITVDSFGKISVTGGSSTIYGHWLSIHDSANNRTAFTIIYNRKSDEFTESSLISYLTNLGFVGGADTGNMYPCVGWRTSGTNEPILGIKTNSSTDKVVFVGGSSGSVAVDSSKLTITEKIFTI